MTKQATTQFTMNFGITKVDVPERIIEGVITSEVWDKQDDKILFEGAVEAMEESADQLGIREMHQPKAVGVLQKWWQDATQRLVFIRVFISRSRDGEDVLIKAQEGVLKGFSIGGKALDWVLSGPGRLIKRLQITEISLVDVPANPQAVFTLVKAESTNKEDDDKDGLTQSSARRGDSVSHISPKTVPNSITKGNRTMAEPENIQKASLATLLNAVKEQLNQAIAQISDDPAGAQQMLTQAQAALEVATSSADAGTGSPKAPATGGTETVEANTATVAAPSSSAVAASPVAPASPASQPMSTPKTASPVTATPASTPSGMASVKPTEEPKTVETGLETTMAKFLEAMTSFSEKIDKLNETLTAKPAVAKSAVPTPVGDLPKTPAPAEPDKVEQAILEGNIDNALAAAGGSAQLYDRVEALVRKSLVNAGVNSQRFFMLNGIPGQQQPGQ